MASLAEALQLAVQHHSAGRLDAAEALCRRILAVAPEQPDALHVLAVVACQRGRGEASERLLRRLLTLRPDHADGHNTLGALLLDQDRVEEAIAAHRRSLALDPTFANAHNNLGNALRRAGHLEEAVAAYREALVLDPRYAIAHSNLGFALQGLGRVEEAIACFNAALAIRPDYALAHWNKAQALLLLGDFAGGWAEYEWGWRSKNGRGPLRDFAQPAWDGGELRGRSVLLYAEQGLGDTLQFVRYAPLVKARGGRVLVECQPALRRLLEGSAGIDELVAYGEPLPSFDVHAALLSLPRLFGTTVTTVPARVPYLAPEPERLAAWRRRLRPRGRLAAGLVWAGKPEHRNDHNRSLPLDLLRPLTEIPGVTWHSLQMGPAAADLTACGFARAVVDLAPELADFVDTAAAVACLDLIVTVDTSVAHLAGALARPTWVLLPFAPDWRWLVGRDDSPWYPSLTLFRQPQPGDWHSVVARVAEALTAPDTGAVHHDAVTG